MSSYSLLQGIFPTQGLNPGHLHCRQILYLLSHQGRPKILQARLQRYIKREWPDVQLGFRKGRETRDQIANIWQKKQGKPRKTSTSASLIYAKVCVWITTNCGKFLKRWEYQTTLPASWETCMQDKKKQSQTWNNELIQNWERSMSSLYMVTLFI